MNITHGMLPGQVLQRDKQGRGGATISGACRTRGDVELRVLKRGVGVRGHDWRVAGQADGKGFTAALSGLRPGGPYRVELRVKSGRKVASRVAVGDIFVGDVWILAGQSNMEGVGNLVHAPAPHPDVRAFFMRDEWAMAEEKLHYLDEAVDKVHNCYGDGPARPPRERLDAARRNMVKGTSPGLAFALDMRRRTRIPQGLIPCAHGGTSMDQWSPALRHLGGESLYGAMMRRYEKLGQPVAGVLWYQGESDANPDAVPVYTEKMMGLVSATRRDMALPRLPWVVVQLGCHAARENEDAWNSIQEQQRRLPEVIQRLDVVSAIDLELDDGIHIGGQGQRMLGRRLARVADRLVHRTAGVKPGIVLRKIEMVRTPHCNVGADCTSVKLTYGSVAGRLQSEGRPAGFALIDAQGQDIHGIYKTSIEGRSVVLHTNMPRVQLELLSVSYGHGRYPICTVTDGEGMSIPGMQAVPIAPDHAPVITEWDTARLKGVTSAARATLARIRTARGWESAPPRAGFGVLPKEAEDASVAVYGLRASLKAAEPLEAMMVFGANAPFKIWVGDRLVFSDSKATLPLNPGQYAVPVSLCRGVNRVVVAFAPPEAGAHLGISARIGKADGTVDERIEL